MNISFDQKVEKTIDIIFKANEMRRVRANYEIEVSSESDYSSDD